LDELENLGPHFCVYGCGADRLEKRHDALHKFPGCNFGEEVGAAIFDAGVGKLVKSVSKAL
jgi:hypothetical protein